MNITSAIDRIKKLGDLVEKLIQQSNEMRERVIRVEENVESANEQVAVVEAKVDRQQALLAAIARERGIDPEAVYEEAGLDAPPEELAADALAADAEDGDEGAEGESEGDDGTAAS